MSAMKMAMFALIWMGAATAQNPPARRDPFVGTFQGDGVVMDLAGSGGEYAGTVTFQGNRMSAKVKASGAGAAGTVEVNGQTYAFALTPSGGGFKLTSEGRAYQLERKGEDAPAATPATTPAPTGSIVGTWRGAQGTARFNPDGTGMVDGTPGRYEIRGDQLTLIGARGQITLGFELRGDVLTIKGSGGAVTLSRVQEEAGAGSVHMELVGRWCWISVTNANQGARQSSRCLTLNANGSYVYAGLTDSYNPYGGATSQSADSGTWTATETTLTARSVTGKVVTYQLEKRNHPKNVRDPMIVLDGQTFVTATNRAPW